MINYNVEKKKLILGIGHPRTGTKFTSRIKRLLYEIWL